MERVFGVLNSSNKTNTIDSSKKEDIYYFIFECANAYSNKYKESNISISKEFSKYNIYDYLYECFDYIHLLSINDNVKDIRSRIKRGIRYE